MQHGDRVPLSARMHCPSLCRVRLQTEHPCTAVITPLSSAGMGSEQPRLERGPMVGQAGVKVRDMRGTGLGERPRDPSSEGGSEQAVILEQ